MIDFHSHILPGIDDGSSNVAESLQLLAMLSEQGVETVVATPHFHADHGTLEEFIEKRRFSYESLADNLPPNSPEILLGAEVRYYQGISRLQNLESLRIGEGKLLLIEMPFSKWTEYNVRELIDLSCRGDIRPVLAHIERYLRMQDAKVWERLLDSEILMQVNASFFNDHFTRRKALRMLECGRVQLIGSDCHNLTNRPPQMKKAYDIIQKKFGEGFVDGMNDYTGELLV